MNFIDNILGLIAGTIFVLICGSVMAIIYGWICLS